MSTPFRLPTTAGRSVDGFLDVPEEPGRRPAIVVCHGFKGFMEWGFFPPLAELLSERGFVVVRFNFSGSGMEPGHDRATDLEGFTASTFTREQEDLHAVLEATAGDGPNPLAPERVDPDRLGLFGHSRGGGASILTSAHEPWKSRLKALVTWAAVATFDRFPDEAKADWRESGVFPILNSRTGQELHLGRELLRELDDAPDRLDIPRAARERTVPWLIVHGTEDEAVPVDEAHRLAEEAASGPGDHELHVIDGAGHTFGAQHPFTGPTPHLIDAMNATQSWFKRHL